MLYPIPPEPSQAKSPHDYTPIDDSSKKRRHGCLTTWLILILIGNIAGTAYTIHAVVTKPWLYPSWVIPVQTVLSIWSIICVVALFKWKKWGFYGFIASAVALMIVAIIVGNYTYMFTPFVSVLALFGVLNIGGDKRGWAQME